MFNAYAPCELPVGNVLITISKTCLRISTVLPNLIAKSLPSSGKLSFIRRIPKVIQLCYAQSVHSVPNPLKTQVIHISTDPITTTKLKGL